MLSTLPMASIEDCRIYFPRVQRRPVRHTVYKTTGRLTGYVMHDRGQVWFEVETDGGDIYRWLHQHINMPDVPIPAPRRAS